MLMKGGKRWYLTQSAANRIQHVETKECCMFREEVAKVEELSERIAKLRGSL